MKKIGLILCVGLLAACGTKPEATVQEDNDVQQQTADDAISDVVRNFTSPDLELYKVHSNVEMMVTRTYEGKMTIDDVKKGELISVDTVYFDEAGRVLRYVSESKSGYKALYQEVYEYKEDGSLKNVYGRNTIPDEVIKYSIKVKRNADGYITSISRIATQEIASNSDVYTWKDGKLVGNTNSGWEWTTDSKYEYDDRGFMASESSEYSEEGDYSVITNKYDYTKLDECDNWISCCVKNICDDYSYDYETDKNVKTGSNVSYGILEREITYRK